VSSLGADEHFRFSAYPVPEVLERRIDQNIAACNAEVQHINQLRAACQHTIDGKRPETPDVGAVPSLSGCGHRQP
jgi:hypothetical protein